MFRVPETATVLMSGGISFGELNQEQVRNAHAQKNFMYGHMLKYPSVHSLTFKAKCEKLVVVLTPRKRAGRISYILSD